MKAPAQVSRLNLVKQRQPIHGFFGLRMLHDADDRDDFGLYWPYDRERDEPIVVYAQYDNLSVEEQRRWWKLEVAFSSAEVFVEWLEANDFEHGDVAVDDPDLAPRRFREAKALFHDHPKAAVAVLRDICEAFPESAEYWYALATQLRRMGDVDGSYQAAIRAFNSNWAFGLPPQGTLRLLRGPRYLLDDPVARRSCDFAMRFGGTKVNPDYELLRECIASYLGSPTPQLGLLLNHNYAYMMQGETIAFQERYGFDKERWCDEHRQLCLDHLGDSRTEMG